MTPPTWPPQDPEILGALEAAWADGSWGRYDGPNCERLTASLAQLHGVEHVLLCSSGTIAVELALRGLGIGANDEVVLAGYDFPGNFRCIEAVGAKPVLVDVDPRTWCLDAEKIEAALGPQTKGIVVSHLHGGLANMQVIRQLADRHHLAVVEDACQATGAVVQGRTAGTWGDVGVLSFGGSKLLTAGRGGAILTRRADVAQRIKICCDRGNHAFPLSELQAAVLVPQLAKLAARNLHRWQNVYRLVTATRELKFLTPVAIPNPPSVTAAETSQPSFYKLAWLWDEQQSGHSREKFVAAAQRAGLAIDAGFRGFAGRSSNRCRKPLPLPHSEAAADATVILHHPVLLSAPDEIDQLAAQLTSVLESLRKESR